MTHDAAVKAWITRRKNEKKNRLLEGRPSGAKSKSLKQAIVYKDGATRKVTWRLWKVDNSGKRILVKEVVEFIKGKGDVGCTIIDDKTII